MLGGNGRPDGACHREGVGLTRRRRLLKKDAYCAFAEALREGLKRDAEGGWPFGRQRTDRITRAVLSPSAVHRHLA
jgi:hypothetical protein